MRPGVRRWKKWVILGLIGGVLLGSPSWAVGVFNLPRFVSPGKFAVGIEPEFIASSGAGLGMNLRYTHGVSDLSNLVVILGTGSGQRQFRMGAAMTFDIFPDLPSQPGVGIAAQGLYVQRTIGGALEIQGIPYIHKTFEVQGLGKIDPFFSIPMGVRLSTNHRYDWNYHLAFGSLFHHSEKIQTILELGVGMVQSDTYLSGGVVYYY